MTIDNVLDFQTTGKDEVSAPTKQERYESMCKELGMLVTDARRINARLQWLEREIDILISTK